MIERTPAARRAAAFLLICSPLIVIPSMISVGHPIVTVVGMVGVTWLFLRRDGQTLASLSIELRTRRVSEQLAGYGSGVLLMVAVATGIRLLLPFPWIRNPRFHPAAAAFSAAYYLCGNSVEELVFRGYSFKRLIEAVGHWRAQLITALLFALFHVINGWSWPVALVGTTTGSLLFGLVFIRWHSVPAAAGVHAATNWARDLLLLDPPVATTLFAPLSPRPWTDGERLAAGAIFEGVVLLACALLWQSIRSRPSPSASGVDGAAHQSGAEILPGVASEAGLFQRRY